DAVSANLDQRNAAQQAAHATELHESRKRLDAVAQQLEQREDAVRSDLERRLDAVGQDLTTVARDLATTGGHLRDLETKGEVAQVSTRAAITQLERGADQLRRNAETLQLATSRADERQLGDSSYFKAQLSLFTQLLRKQTEGKPGKKGSPARSVTTPEIDARLADTYYVAFENAFRGQRADIKERQAIYLPYISGQEGPCSDLPVLDLGCGRGEWLELLGENGFTARGIDLNLEMVDYCRSRGLEASAEDALECLKAQPDYSLAAVTAFHLIEHLPFAILTELWREALRVLEPGGSLICETPNPANIQVGAHFFYRDPTHQRPLPPDSTRFLAQHVGFREAEILPMNPCTPETRIAADGLEVTERFNEMFYGAQDYAIVARK
ncbi:MAG: methyltransferase domain-containing protein, partial [Chthoniobacterales bacterium]